MVAELVLACVAAVALSCGPGCFLRHELRLVSQVFLGTTFQYHQVAQVVYRWW